ncbi:MAG TPA: DinB family protein [Terracidiphilus sp.]|nr:DinB family protein [Terracidiphilus sp.]
MNIHNELISELDREGAKTRKILEAIPEDADWNWKPHEKSMTLGSLAGHVTDMTGDWGVYSLTLDKLEFSPDHKWESYVPTSHAEMLARFDKNLVRTRETLTAANPEKWDDNWKLIFGGQTWIDQPRYQVFRELVLNHMIHHRAQIGVYIRLLGGKLPGCYGPSADEM